MRRLRVALLVHRDLLVPASLAGLSRFERHRRKTELDVLRALARLGHEVRQLGVVDELDPIRAALEDFAPQIVFNLLEEFQGEAIYDQHVVAYLELLRMPYTGCNPRGLVLARDKALAKKLVAWDGIRVPRFAVFRAGERVRRPRHLAYPLMVKSLLEESSMGIARASIVRDDAALALRVRRVQHRTGADALVEEFVSGRELYVAILGNRRLQALPPLELVARRWPAGEELIATERLKHDPRYQRRHGVGLVRARLPAALHRQLARESKLIYRALGLEGYGRIDFRLDREGRLYFLEANPNPDVARAEEMASAARAAGIPYAALLQRILSLGLRR
jgi:D-alanine-D-alanine ligase